MDIIKAINKNYYENEQESSIRFTPVVIKDNNYYQLFKPVSCRDKMQDVPLFLKNGRGLSIDHCGFKFGTKEENELLKYQGDTLLLNLTFKYQIEKNSLVNKLNLLTDLEKELGIEETRVIFSNKEENYNLIIESDLFWVKSPLTISYFTFFLRVLSYDFIDKKDSFEELFDEIEKRWSERDIDGDRVYKGNEDEFIPALLSPFFNFRYILKNIDFLLGDNLLTYFNDKEFLEIYNDRIDNNEVLSDTLSLNYSFKLIDYSINRYIYLSSLHGNSGFRTIYQYLNQTSYDINNKSQFISRYITKINNYKLKGDYLPGIDYISFFENLVLLYQKELEDV